MKEILQELERKSCDRPVELVRQQHAGKKVIEYYGDFIPEQWIRAIGAEPYLSAKAANLKLPKQLLTIRCAS